jgi:hypothetical protein
VIEEADDDIDPDRVALPNQVKGFATIVCGVIFGFVGGLATSLYVRSQCGRFSQCYQFDSPPADTVPSPPTIAQQAKIFPDDLERQDRFGSAVAVDGDTVVAGAPDDGSGSAYVFERSNGTWSQEAKLRPDDGNGGRFGSAVALDGDTALVGSRNTDSAYLFTRLNGTWSQATKLEPAGTPGRFGDGFGWAVALDGSIALVGAPFDDTAYVFERSAGWIRVAMFSPDDVSNGNFGKAVALAGDEAAVSATKDGAVYTFERAGSGWTRTDRVTPDDGGGGLFGESVAFDGDTLAVGAPLDDTNGTRAGSAYTFTSLGNDWGQETKLLPDDGDSRDRFGQSVALLSNTAFVGAPLDEANGDGSGSVYAFERDTTAWSQSRKLTPTDGNEDDKFGGSASFDGTTLVVGAAEDGDSVPGLGTNAGSAYVFDS